MVNNRLFLVSFLALFWGCAGYKPVPLDGFAPAKHATKKSWRALSADGVLFSSRTIKNKPKADLAFWHGALKTRMLQAGYRFLGDSTLSQNSGEVILLRMATPLGQKDFLYYIALSVQDKKIRVVEAAGETSKFLLRQTEILKALTALN